MSLLDGLKNHSSFSKSNVGAGRGRGRGFLTDESTPSSSTQVPGLSTPSPLITQASNSNATLSAPRKSNLFAPPQKVSQTSGIVTSSPSVVRGDSGTFTSSPPVISQKSKTGGFSFKEAAAALPPLKATAQVEVVDPNTDDWDADVAPSREELSLLNKAARGTGLADVHEHDIEIFRQDPNNPLYAVKSFRDLHLRRDLLNGLYSMGFDRPSRIQELALPAILVHPPQNMIAQSQSGTGKTAAFVIAMLYRVDVSQNNCQCLCLVPTFELALQIASVTREMGRFVQGLRVLEAVRGAEPGELTEDGKLTAHIVIGTAGTVEQWINRRKIIDLNQIRVFCLDEADNMLDQQNFHQICLNIKRRLPPTTQYLLFSATYEERVMEFAHEMVPNPQEIRLKRQEETLENIHQFVVEVPGKEAKYQAICRLYGVCTVAQSMIFCASRREATWLAEQLIKDGFQVGLLIGSKPVEERAAMIRQFRDAEYRVLVATNVAARGLDIASVNVVINYDMPVTESGTPDCETYLHRIGRSGRFGKLGFAINMVDSPKTVAILRHIESHFGIEVPLLDLNNTDDLLRLERLARLRTD